VVAFHKAELNKYVMNITIARVNTVFFSNECYACEISSSHGGEYDVQNCLLGCTVM
jgi:hypothetical protein